MKKILFIMLALVTLSTTIYASFPVTSNGPATDSVVLQDIQLTTEAPPAEFHFGGFILGLLLGLIGVGLAYIFSSDPDFRRNAWYGLGTWMIICLLLMSAV